MGLISKIGKGIKGAFKKVGKAIKSGLKSVGKFMDKIGIVGQIGLSLLLPGIGGMLANGWNSLVGSLANYSGFGSSVVKAAGGFLKTATEIGGRMGKAFNSVTSAVKNVVGETLKFGANKLGLGKVATGIGETFGSEYFKGLGESISNASLDNIGGAFKGGLANITESFGNVFNPESAISKNLNIQFDPSNVDATGQPISTSSSGVSLEDMSTEVQGIDAGSSLNRVGQGYQAPSLLDGGPKIPTVSDEVAISGFEAARDSALNTEIKSVGEGNFAYEKMQEVQRGLAKKLSESEGYQAFKKDPVGTTAGFVGGQIQEGAGKAVKTAAFTTVAEGLNIDTTPDVTQRVYSMSTPNIDYVNVEPASMMDRAFFNASQNIINGYPYGASAVAYESNYYENLNAARRGVNI